MGPEVTESTSPAPPPETGARRALTGLGLVALLASALFGANVGGVRERLLGSETPTARPAAVARGPEATAGSAPAAPQVEPPAKETVLRSQPWWQGVTKLEGTGSTTAAVNVDSGAIQWRVKPTCQAGRLVVRASGQARAVVETACPASPTGYGTRTGAMSLDVTADGPWQLQVEQQVDVPLSEPPLPVMNAPGASKVATGSLYRVDQVGTGKVTLYRLADRSYALRLDDFFVTANVDLELQLSPLDAPRTTEEISTARSPSIAALDVTTGSLNFTLPPTLDPNKYRSLVIWCERTHNAYAAATLTPP